MSRKGYVQLPADLRDTRIVHRTDPATGILHSVVQPKRRGRPSAGTEGRSVQVTAKLTPSERRACEDAARSDGKSLSEWARDALQLASRVNQQGG